MSTRVPHAPTFVFAAAEWSRAAAVLPEPAALAARAIGEKVVDGRTSWVRRLPSPIGPIFIKTYEYETWGDRLRNWARRTAPWRRSRAANEFRALTWLREHGFAAPEPLACWEWRQLGFLVRATLVTAAFDGVAADQRLARATPAERARIAGAIGRYVGELHRNGFRDRNLDLRNLLVRDEPGAFTIAKIDSPRFRLVAAGRRDDRLARADWRRLLPQLAQFACDGPARRAAAQDPSGQRSASS